MRSLERVAFLDFLVQMLQVRQVVYQVQMAARAHRVHQGLMVVAVLLEHRGYQERQVVTVLK